MTTKSKDFKIINDILFCKVLCIDDELEKMGMDADEWLEFAIDLKEVIGVKLYYNNKITDKGVLYTAYNEFITDVDYQELLKMWFCAKTGKSHIF